MINTKPPIAVLPINGGLRITKTRLSIIVSVLMLLISTCSLASYYAGWKSKIEASAVEHAAILKVLNEHGPLMKSMQDEASLNVVQQAKIGTLESAVANLVQAQEKTNDKLDRLVDTILEERYHRSGTR